MWIELAYAPIPPKPALRAAKINFLRFLILQELASMSTAFAVCPNTSIEAKLSFAKSDPRSWFASAIRYEHDALNLLIDVLIELAKYAQSKGILSLEEAIVIVKAIEILKPIE